MWSPRPGSLAEDGAGTVMRPARPCRYAEEAGFCDVEILPIAHDFWRFDRLHG